MAPLFYIMKKSFKNIIKELLKKPLALIGYILFALLMIFSIVISIISPSNKIPNGSPQTFSMIMFGIMLFMFYTSIKTTLKGGTSFFKMADVTILFTSPIKPQNILAYGFINQLYATFFIIILLVFQIPNLKINFSINAIGFIIIYITLLFFIFSNAVFGMLIYLISSLNIKAKKYIEKAFDALFLIILIYFVFEIITTKNFSTSIKIVLDNPYLKYIPLLGWFKTAISSAVYGINSSFYISYALIISSLIIIVYLIFTIQSDYYEDVIGATEKKQELISMKKQGNLSLYYDKNKFKKVKQTYKGSGAYAIFQRQLLEYKKTGFLFIDRATFILLIIGLISNFLIPNSNIYIILFYTSYMMFFFLTTGKWSREVTKPYLFLIPDSNAKKLFYATLPEILKNAIDGSILFITAGIIMKSPILSIILCAINYTAFSAVFIYTDVLSRKLFGSTHSKNLSMFLKMLITFFLVMPGVIIFIALIVALKSMPNIEYIGLICIGVYNFIIVLIIFLLGKSSFDNIESV